MHAPLQIHRFLLERDHSLPMHYIPQTFRRPLSVSLPLKRQPPPTLLELEAPLHERDTAIERLESDHRWLAERERDEREEKKCLSKDSEEEKGE
jgi:hypothetical protein